MNSLKFFLLLFIDDTLKFIENIVRVFNQNLLIFTEKLRKLYSILFNSGQLFIVAGVTVFLVENQDRQILKNYQVLIFDITYCIIECI